MENGQVNFSLKVLQDRLGAKDLEIILAQSEIEKLRNENVELKKSLEKAEELINNLKES